MAESPARPSSVGAIWLASAVVGVCAGLLSLVFPVLGRAIALLYLAGTLFSRSVAPAVGGFLVSSGSVWIILLVLADQRCREANATPGQGCVGSDTSPWLIAGLGMMILGVIATAVAVRSSGRSRRRTSPPR
jgi:hypothetical protein